MAKDLAQSTDVSVAVIIPAYKVAAHVLDVIAAIDSSVHAIYVVDDACPQGSGRVVQANCVDPRVRVIYSKENQGVGGAVMAGYRQAISDGHAVLVKVDGDGQMNPRLIRGFVDPIIAGSADYTKGNRFHDLEGVTGMPPVRIFGNGVLSLMAKVSTGYWNIFDPTNGYTAIHARVARALPFHKLSRRYFFENDVLFRLGTLRAVVHDVPMRAVYADEESSLRIGKIVGEFLYKSLRNTVKRIFYNYFLRDMNAGTIEIVAGSASILFGLSFGAYHWLAAANSGTVASGGTVMIAALPLILGFQMWLGFLYIDIAGVPSRPIWPALLEMDRPCDACEHVLARGSTR